MTLEYGARAVPGALLKPGTATVIFVPRLVYPNGYRLSVSGARVTSRTGAEHVAMVANHRGSRVSVTVTPR